MKLHNCKPQPNIVLGDGQIAYHSTSETNQGMLLHHVQYPRSTKKKPEEPMFENEFQEWLIHNRAKT